MAFFPISRTSKFGPELIQLSNNAIRLVDGLDLHVARVTEMTDQQVATEYGTTLTQSQLLTTLTNAKNQVAHQSITDLRTKIG